MTINSRIDLIVSARRVYTVDEAFSVADCVAIDRGRVIAVGKRHDIEEIFLPRRWLDFGNAVVYPGFIDPHCHFLSYGYVLQRAQLFGARSWEETVARLAAHAAASQEPWIQGRGWDQNIWESSRFPDNELLDRIFPNKPVLAIRVDGHAAMANSAALVAAGINAATNIEGGKVVVSGGRPTGLLLDNAVDKVKSVIQATNEATTRRALLAAQEKCFAAGLTSVSNAGTEKNEALFMDKMQREGKLSIRIYVMLLPTRENIDYFASSGPRASESLTVRSFKMYADGALGSRGAYLLEDYSDDPGNRGLLTLDEGELDRICGIARTCGFQMNVHAIGDKAARLVLDAYERHLEPGNDLRWRLEHAQLVTDGDIERIARLGVVPSVQAVHAVSDMAWTESRLGPGRLSRSHRYFDVLERCGWLANGSDFPIEKVDPLRGFRAAVFRKDDNRKPEGGWRPDQAIGRIEALKAMTIWAAKANFEEDSRGSLETGKWADIVVLDKDLIEGDADSLWDAKVLATIVGGETR